jgi:hypothetical protein
MAIEKHSGLPQHSAERLRLSDSHILNYSLEAEPQEKQREY